jgi:hypothetical protein
MCCHVVNWLLCDSSSGLCRYEGLYNIHPDHQKGTSMLTYGSNKSYLQLTDGAPNHGSAPSQLRRCLHSISNWCARFSWYDQNGGGSLSGSNLRSCSRSYTKRNGSDMNGYNDLMCLPCIFFTISFSQRFHQRPAEFILTKGYRVFHSA